MDVVAKFKLDFFDSSRVLARVDRARRRVLSRFGAFVRTRARSSIRKRKKASAPGQPPSSHEGSLKRLLFFAYDASSRSVVVGPVPFQRGEAPELLEEGGTAIRRRRVRPAGSRKASAPQAAAFRRLVAAGRITRPEPEYVTYQATYRARPYMAPAAEAERPKFAPLWRDSVAA